MESGRLLRFSWTCLLLICSAAGFPSKAGYMYPYAATWSSSGGPEAPRPPLAYMLKDSDDQQSSSPSIPAAPVAYAPSYEPNSFVMSYGSSSEEPSSAPEVPAQSPGYVGVPLVSWEDTQSFFDPPQPGSGSSEHYNMASTQKLEASSPEFEANGNPSTADSDPEELLGPFSSKDEQREWLPSPDFPDFDVFDRTVEAPPGETSPLPPSSYIIQSRNGFMRAREVLSHMKYYPEFPQPPVFPYDTEDAPSKLPPMSGPKGGKTV